MQPVERAYQVCIHSNPRNFEQFGIRNIIRRRFMGEVGEVTRLLREMGAGDQEAMNRLLPLVYQELRRLAAAYFRRERVEHTLQPTALVHEAYLRMVDQRGPIQSRGHFMALAATQMRRILVDYARLQHAERRGGGAERVLLDDTIGMAVPRPVDVMALDTALGKLEALDPELVRLVELRFFGGLTVEETAEVMGTSTATVKRSWSSARAFLRRTMEGGPVDSREVGKSPGNF